MKLLFREVSLAKWESFVKLPVLLFLMLNIDSALAEPPNVQLRPVAPGWIAVDWSHPNDNADSITLEREDPAFTWTFTALNNTFVDMGLQPNHIYRYRVCAIYSQAPDCTQWLSAQTMATPPPDPPLGVPRFTSSSATSTSITVNWTSPKRYEFYQVRWNHNGSALDRQNKVSELFFIAGGLLEGPLTTYHFIVQGCDSGFLGSTCSKFSAPIEVTLAPPPLPPIPKLGVKTPNEFQIVLNWDLPLPEDGYWIRSVKLYRDDQPIYEVLLPREVNFAYVDNVQRNATHFYKLCFKNDTGEKCGGIVEARPMHTQRKLAPVLYLLLNK